MKTDSTFDHGHDSETRLGDLRRSGPDEHRHSPGRRSVCRRRAGRRLRSSIDLEHETDPGLGRGQEQGRPQAPDANGSSRRLRQLRTVVA